MPKPNYGFEKRQKELAKQRKKEDKLKARADRKAGILPAGEEQPADQQDGAAPDPAATPEPPPAPN